jgi:dihydroorotate dehydrogenase (NAD+) catalytic subunit
MPKQDLTFRSAITNMAGMLGYAPDPRKTPNYDQLGAFFTNPISLLPRSPAETRCAIPFPGGVLLHSGFPNPGLVRVVSKYGRQWTASTIPVILHLMVDEARTMTEMLDILEDVEGVSGIEVSFRPGSEPQMVVQVLRSALMEWPVIAQLEVEQMQTVLPDMQDCGLSAVSLVPKRGRLPVAGLDAKKQFVSGRLFGAALFPQALADLECALAFGIPVIASGGVTTLKQVNEMLKAGALAVQVDTILWGNGLN